MVGSVGVGGAHNRGRWRPRRSAAARPGSPARGGYLDDAIGMPPQAGRSVARPPEDRLGDGRRPGTALAGEHQIHEAEDTAVHSQVLAQPLVKSGPHLMRTWIVTVQQRPLLPPGPPGRLEFIPLVLVSAA